MVADRGNRTLKRVDESNKTISKFCLTSKWPTDVCCISPEEFAVAFGTTKVYVYSTDGIVLIRTLNLEHQTNKISCNGGLLYCPGCGDNTLYVHSGASGKKLREFRPKDTDGFYLFSEIDDIALNGTGDRVYLTNWRGLVCVNKDGQLIFRLYLADLSLSDQSGVTIGHRGHVFLYGAGSQNVVEVTEDGHIVGEILSLKDGIKWRPGCLSYHVSRSILYVGGKSEKLLMVELTYN